MHATTIFLTLAATTAVSAVELRHWWGNGCTNGYAACKNVGSGVRQPLSTSFPRH